MYIGSASRCLPPIAIEIIVICHRAGASWSLPLIAIDDNVIRESACWISYNNYFKLKLSPWVPVLLTADSERCNRNLPHLRFCRKLVFTDDHDRINVNRRCQSKIWCLPPTAIYFEKKFPLECKSSLLQQCSHFPVEFALSTSSSVTTGRYREIQTQTVEVGQFWLFSCMEREDLHKA